MLLTPFLASTSTVLTPPVRTTVAIVETVAPSGGCRCRRPDFAFGPQHGETCPLYRPLTPRGTR